jgi:hypothetical protein
VAVGFEDAAPVHYGRVPLALFGVYVHVAEWLDCRDGHTTLRAGWGSGRRKDMKKRVHDV